MKRKEKGRKIYRTKEKNYYEKTSFQKFMSGLLTVVLIGGIGFLGYSIAEPLINFTNHQGDNPEENIPAETTTVPDETTVAADDENETTETTTVEDTTQATTEENPVVMEEYKAFAIPAESLESEETLRAALSSVPLNQGIEYIEVPLKVKGGAVCYLSTVATNDAFKENQKLNLVKISGIIKDSGFVPVGIISTLNDNIMPSVDSETGYITADGSLWYDSSLKPWISPYSDKTVFYLSAIADEISGMGFEKIVCTDFVYPKFTESELKKLDERLSQPDRCRQLTSVANVMYDAAVSNGSATFIEVSAADVLGGRAEILQPMLLSVNTIVLNINIDELGDGISDGRNYYEFKGTPAEKAEKCMGFISEQLRDFNVAVRISGNGITTEELIETKEKIAEYGYNSFVLG